MGRAYNVIDADGHILEPLDLWDKYIDPKFRDRAPRGPRRHCAIIAATSSSGPPNSASTAPSRRLRTQP